MSKPCVNRCVAAGLALLLSLGAGCGTGGERGYEARMNQRLKSLAQDDPFARMNLTLVPGTPLAFQLPPMFTDPPMVDGQGGDPRRAKPPFEVGQIKLAYEGLLEDETQGKMAYYLYVYAVDMSLRGAREPVNVLRRQLTSAFDDITVTSEDAHVSTPDGRSLSCKMVSLEAPQEFCYLAPDGAAEYRSVEGIVRFYVRREGDFVLMLGWRVPSYLKEHIGLDEWAPRAAGSVVVKK
jgi:hypothetical protein